MDKIEINLGNEELECNKMIATVKNSAQNNILEQLVAGNWTLEELITAKSNFETLLEQQIYKSLTPQQQSLLDKIQEKEQNMKEKLMKNLTAEEKELYQQLDTPSYQPPKQNNPIKKDSSQQDEISNQKTEDKVVNLNEYRSSK